MRIAKYATGAGASTSLGVVVGERVRPIGPPNAPLTEILHADDPAGLVDDWLKASKPEDEVSLDTVRLLSPIDRQEVWGAGVTYERSKQARQEESEQGGSFYDLVYRAARPELFFKATPSRVVGPGESNT